MHVKMLKAKKVTYYTNMYKPLLVHKITPEQNR